MTVKLVTIVAALAAGSSLFADPCKCGKPECACGDDCGCTAGACNCGCAIDKDVLAEEDDSFPVSAEFGLAFDSKYVTYGVVDGKDPILTPSATVTLFDTLYFGVEAIFDVTKGNGKRGGYGNRAFKYTTLDMIVGATHDFDLGETLGALSVDFNYIYEYIPRSCDPDVGDTQYLNLELSLGDLWLEPTLAIERDLMADDGTYVNFEIGHTFTLIDSESEGGDPVLTLRPAVGQGFGNSQRTRGYFSDTTDGFDHAGLMDTSISLTAEWAICDHLTLSGYVACYDYVFDRKMRHAARDRNGAWSDSDSRYADSWNVVGGLALKASF